MLAIFNLLLTTFTGGSGGWAFTELAKIIPFIPINEGQTAKLRTTAAVFSTLSVVLIGFADHTLDLSSAQGLFTALIQFGGAWGISHFIHSLVKSEKTGT